MDEIYEQNWSGHCGKEINNNLNLRLTALIKRTATVFAANVNQRC